MELGAAMEAPRGGVPPLSELFHAASALPAGITILGDLLWAFAYIVAIVIGFKRQTFGIPILAVCLNITWEFVYTAIHPPGSAVTLGLHLAWLLIDVVILYQIFRYGRLCESTRPLGKYYAPAILAVLALCIAGHLTWHAAQNAMAIFPDTLGVTSAFIINLVMSVLFVSMAMRHPNHPGLSLTVAWAKLVGTALISVGNTIVFFTGSAQTFEVQVRKLDSVDWVDAGTIGAHNFDPGFMFFLFISIFVFDVIYVVLLGRRQKLASSAASA
jgi:hypothetical protein